MKKEFENSVGLRENLHEGNSFNDEMRLNMVKNLAKCG